MFIFVARFCVSFLHESNVYITNTNTGNAHGQDMHTDTLLRLHNVFVCARVVHGAGDGAGVCRVCVISVYVSNDIWRKFYGVYPKIAEAPEPQAWVSSPSMLFVYLLFIMRFVQLHFIANTHRQRQTETDRLMLMRIGIGVFKIL